MINYVLKKKDIETIENKLTTMKYEDIPEEFIKIVNEKFDTYSYLKSLIELSKNVQ